MNAEKKEWLKVDEIDFQAFKDKLDKAILQNKQLRRANINKDKTIKYLRRVIKKLKDEAEKERKPHYRNGQKRGKTRNG